MLFFVFVFENCRGQQLFLGGGGESFRGSPMFSYSRKPAYFPWLPERRSVVLFFTVTSVLMPAHTDLKTNSNCLEPKVYQIFCLWVHKAVAKPEIFFLQWQLDIFKTVLRWRFKVIERVASHFQCLQHVGKVQFDEYSATLSRQFCCIICPWLHVHPLLFYNSCGTRKKCYFACANKKGGCVATA